MTEAITATQDREKQRTVVNAAKIARKAECSEPYLKQYQQYLIDTRLR